ncbi:PAS domain-containing protein [Spirosoma gilvum]
MDFCGPYDKKLAEQHRPTLLTPLLAGWEFWGKSSPVQGHTGWQAIAKANDWVLTKPIREGLRAETHSVVVTDTNQFIQYVNDHFERMTGYVYAEAIGRRPSFLQGQATSPTTRQRIREAIARRKSINGRLVNYRKDQTPYVCQVKIRPVLNRQKQVVNFIAFEQEVPVRERKRKA